MSVEATPEVVELAQRMLAKQNERLAKMKIEIAKAHPHALVDTLVFDQDVKKFKCNIRCTECGDESRVVYTSDLHQVNLCNKCSDRKKEAKKSLQKAQQAAARRLISSGAVTVTLPVLVPITPEVVATAEKAAREVVEVPAEAPVPTGWDKVETSTEEMPIEPKKKRGRPKGSKNKK